MCSIYCILSLDVSVRFLLDQSGLIQSKVIRQRILSSHGVFIGVDFALKGLSLMYERTPPLDGGPLTEVEQLARDIIINRLLAAWYEEDRIDISLSHFMSMSEMALLFIYPLEFGRALQQFAEAYGRKAYLQEVDGYPESLYWHRFK